MSAWAAYCHISSTVLTVNHLTQEETEVSYKVLQSLLINLKILTSAALNESNTPSNANCLLIDRG